VAEIIRRHLKDIHTEIQRLDPEMLNLDDAGDKAEIARQVLTALVDQLRGFASVAEDCRGEETVRVVTAESSAIATETISQIRCSAVFIQRKDGPRLGPDRSASPCLGPRQCGLQN
jgi:hypothetical protein